MKKMNKVKEITNFQQSFRILIRYLQNEYINNKNRITTTNEIDAIEIKFYQNYNFYISVMFFIQKSYYAAKVVVTRWRNTSYILDIFVYFTIYL